jgi:hypothetical protein
LRFAAPPTTDDPSALSLVTKIFWPAPIVIDVVVDRNWSTPVGLLPNPETVEEVMTPLDPVGPCGPAGPGTPAGP